MLQCNSVFSRASELTLGYADAWRRISYGCVRRCVVDRRNRFVWLVGCLAVFLFVEHFDLFALQWKVAATFRRLLMLSLLIDGHHKFVLSICLQGYWDYNADASIIHFHGSVRVYATLLHILYLSRPPVLTVYCISC